MPRPPREHLRCPSCTWQGTSSRGRARTLVYASSSVIVAALLLASVIGWLSVDVTVPTAITIALLSIGVRMLIRADRCPQCGAALWTPPPPEQDT